MKKVVYVDNHEGRPKAEPEIIGFIEEIKWRSIKHTGGPKLRGKYIVSDGNGDIGTCCCIGNERGIVLLEQYASGEYSKIIFANGNALTDTDILNLCRQYYVWYEEDDIYTWGEWDGRALIIHKAPKYYVDKPIGESEKVFKHGPIDDESDSYETVETDKFKW